MSQNKTYKVTVYQTVLYADTVEVVASSEEQAVELASQSDNLGEMVDIETGHVEVEEMK